jgi:peptide methionine sulfoxide reductase MsrA
MGTEMAAFAAGCFWSVEAAFRCGVVRRDDGSVLIYYGGNDTVMNVGVTHEDVLIALCERYGQDPLTGHLTYDIRATEAEELVTCTFQF